MMKINKNYCINKDWINYQMNQGSLINNMVMHLMKENKFQVYIKY